MTSKAVDAREASRREWLKAALATAALGAAPGRAFGAGEPHLPTIEDFLNLREIGVVRPAPNGSWLAVEVYRPRAEPAQRAQDLGGYPRSDIWLVDEKTAEVRKLTRGASDGSACWAPIWSPNGDAIAVLTNRGDRGSRPAILHPKSGALTILGDQAVAMSTNFGSSGRPDYAWGAWRTNSEFLTVLLGEDDTNLFELVADPKRYYEDVWAKTKAGILSVTTWDSRRPVVCGTLSKLVTFDLRAGGPPRRLHTGAIRSVSLSRSSRYAALIVATEPRAIHPTAPIEPTLVYNAYNIDMLVQTQLSIIDLVEERSLGVAPGVTDLTAHDVRRHPQWGPDDQAVVVPAFATGQPDRVFRVVVPSLAPETFVARSPLDAELVTALLARRRPDRPIKEVIATDRIDLSRHQADGTPIMLIPGTVLSLSGDDVAVQADGQLVSVDAEGRPVDTLNTGDASLLSAQPAWRPTGQVLFGSPEPFLVERSAGRLRRRDLRGPRRLAVPMASAGSPRRQLWADANDSPTRLLATDVDSGGSSELLHLNPYMEAVWQPEVRSFDYALPGGRPATAAVLLPPGYSDDRVYPVVIHGYPSQMWTPKNLRKATQWRESTVNRLLLCAHGYVVVLPSMPSPPASVVFDPLDYYSAQVESLVIALLAKKMAVEGKIGFFGHSYGGFAALAVAARSRTVNAVAAYAPFTDLISRHDVPYGWYDRLTCAPNVARFHSGQFEYRSGPVVRMGNPPDVDLAKYVVNSPRFQLTDKSPPLLLLQTQFDSQGFRQSDAVFMHLSRLGVPVREARYWGEAHNLANPANLRDAWNEVRTWFDRYLR